MKKKFAFLVMIAAIVAKAQMPAAQKPKSDAEKIASAMRAGPKFVTQNATVLDWPSSPGGEFRVLRAGTNQWTCLPGRPEGAHDEPGCFDQVFLQFMKDSMAGRTPNVQSVGVSYMYGGFWVPNKSHAMGSDNEFHVGPHIMIIGLDQKMMQTLNHDGSNGEPYVNHLAGHSELYLVIPIREWEDSHAVSPSAQLDNSRNSGDCLRQIATTLRKAFDTPGPVLVGVHGDYQHNVKLLEQVYEGAIL